MFLQLVSFGQYSPFLLSRFLRTLLRRWDMKGDGIFVLLATKHNENEKLSKNY